MVLVRAILMKDVTKSCPDYRDGFFCNLPSRVVKLRLRKQTSAVVGLMNIKGKDEGFGNSIQLLRFCFQDLNFTTLAGITPHVQHSLVRKKARAY